MTPNKLKVVRDLIVVLHYQAGLDDDEEMREVADAIAELLSFYEEETRKC